MRNLTLALSAAALTISGAAFAQAAPTQPRAAKPDLTRAEAQTRAQAMFARMDGNGDGTLNEADRAVMQDRRFQQMDTDRNGALSRAEFEAMHAKRGERGGRMAKRAGAPAQTEAQKAERKAEMFARLDTDRNGSVSRAELDAARSARATSMAGKREGRQGRTGMAAAGPVTQQAFLDRALARFDRADANRDGTVTQAERKTARDAMRQQWQAQRAARQQS